MKQTNRIPLTPEENYLWDCARHWQEPQLLVAPPALDWAKVLATDVNKRMQTLLYKVLKTTGQLDQFPAEVRNEFEAGVSKAADYARMMSHSLRHYLQQSAVQHIDTVVLKGLSLSINLYEDAAVRPGGDIDILVRASDVAASLAILDKMGLGQNWPKLMDDDYYKRHHLHLQRCSKDAQLWYEIHWAVEHPLTLLTIDYEALIARTTAGTLLDAPVRELSLTDLLLTLSAHLVKHAVYLPGTLNRPDLARVFLADDMLTTLLDVAEVLKQYEPAIEWQEVIDRAKAWGAVDIVGSVLYACHEFLQAPVPQWALAALPVRRPGPVTGRIMQRVVAYKVAKYLGQKQSRVWDFLLTADESFILRPIRLLELFTYCFPGRDFYRRRYGSASPGTAVQHFWRALGQYGRAAVDAIYYTWKRQRRLKLLAQTETAVAEPA